MGKHNIRWRQSDIEKLSKVVRNFNNKIARTVKKNGSNAFLPDKISKKDLKNNIGTRQEFNRIMNSLNRFNKDKNSTLLEKSSRGAIATRWEVKEFTRKQAIENARRTRERNRINSQNVKIGGESTGIQRAQMGTIKENELRPSHKNFYNLSEDEWKKAVINIESKLNSNYQEKRKNEMRDNYIKGLKDGEFLSRDKDLETLIRGVSLDEFFDTVEVDETATFLFYNDPIAFDDKLEKIRDSWETVANEHKQNYINTLPRAYSNELKNFLQNMDTVEFFSIKNNLENASLKETESAWTNAYESKK